ncbi:MAG: peptidase M28, partial [Acidobacteria bacterium]
IFTSTRDGDLDLYRMDADGRNVKRLTNSPGYDGGAFFSPHCSKIVWRASRPKEGPELDEYKRLLAQGLVHPTQLEIWTANADGTDARQVTYLNAASFAPSFFPDGKRIIFSSNYGDPKGREFDLWAINLDGTNLERITWTLQFDGFPMFSPDGTRLAFASNRNGTQPGETDIFVARWVEK